MKEITKRLHKEPSDTNNGLGKMVINLFIML